MESSADQQLRKYIEEIFRRYDSNKSGVLNAAETATFMNDLYMLMGMPIQIGLKEAQKLIREIDINGDGKLNKAELFAAFKSLHPADLAMLP
jgi:Ca2+-binding EF-hand superfamily protein